MPNGIFKFEDFELDGGRYELRRGDRVLKLEKIPMDLLTILVESDGQLVTRDQIIQRIWGKDVFLDTEHGINTAIRKIRQALGDDPDQPRFVQTVTGKGYRFIATTTLAASANGYGNRTQPAVNSPAPSSEKAAAASSLSSDVKSGATVRWVASSLFAVVVLAAVLLGLNVRGVRDRLFSSAKPRIHSLAVLPLENLSADPAQEYFADGMTDELITMLAKNPGLRVVSRTSVMQYKKAHRPLPDIARELGVDGILEGSVERTGNRVHVSAQLIYAPQDRHLWAESYDRDVTDVGALQSDLARNIAQQVGLTASSTSSPTRLITPEAHDAYLMGRYLWYAADYDRAEEYFKKALQLQPDYAAAWAGVADYYTVSAVEADITSEVALAKAEPAARKAIELDDSSAEAHHAMAAVCYFLRWDWNRAEEEITRAIKLNPQLSGAYHLDSYILGTLQRTEESIQADRKSMELDPFVRPWALGYALLRARQFDAALAELRVRSEAQPGDCITHDMLSEAYFYKGMAAEYVREQAQCSPKERNVELEKAFRQGGLPGVLEWRLRRVKNAAAKRHVSPLELAFAYARTRRKDDTLYYLEQAYKERIAWLVHLQSDATLDFIHSDPRYEAIVKKMNLPPAP